MYSMVKKISKYLLFSVLLTSCASNEKIRNIYHTFDVYPLLVVYFKCDQPFSFIGSGISGVYSARFQDLTDQGYQDYLFLQQETLKTETLFIIKSSEICA